MKAGARLLRQVPALVVVAVGVGFAAYAIRRERAESERQQQALDAQVASRAAVFARRQLGEMLALCRRGWEGELGFGYEPVALAWTREGVDAYFFQGSDTGSLRRVRCEARGVSRGPRVAHPLDEPLPAEAPSKADEPDQAEWLHAVGRASARSFGSGDLAFELLRHPVTGAVVSRAWRAGPERAEATLDPADGPAFAFLPASPAFQPAPGAAAKAVRLLPRKRWLAQVEAAFALLEQSIPKGAGIAELTLEDDQIEVTIAWPTPAFDGAPPAPFGDKTFDEYGVADTDWWYPRTEPGFGCATGLPLAGVRAAFAEAQARPAARALARAWYSCSPAYSDGRKGVFHLVPRPAP